jgi:hypothetical protein
VASLLLYLGLEAAVFRSGWYNNCLEPNSTTGQVEYNLHWLRRAPQPKVPDVLVVGDSRIAEGFSTRIAQATVHDRLHFTNFGMPGSSPRVWYYALRDADPKRNRFSTIVVALDRYSDEDGLEDPRDRPTDLNYLLGRLGFSDCYGFSKSFADRTMRRGILTGCFLKGTVLRSDVRDFLADIPGRLDRAEDWRNKGAGYIAGYGGKPEELTGLTVDREKHTIHFPPDLKDWQTRTIQNTVFPDPAPQNGALTRYRTQWLGGILNLYKDSATRIVFIQIPRAPWPGTDASAPARFVKSVEGNPRLTVLPAGTFEDLERPEIFADGLHLNHAGRELFSARLAEKLAGQPVAHALVSTPPRSLIASGHAERKLGGRAAALPH